MSQTALEEPSRTSASNGYDLAETELINKLNLQLRVVEEANIQLRRTIASELSSFYSFLTKLFLPEEALKCPPREGWSFITAKRFAFLGKTDTVIDLYKHIPYISQDDEEEYPMGPKCVCLDYTGRRFRTDALTPRVGKSQPPEALDQMPKEHKWSRLADPQHIAVIAKPVSKDGLYILLDTRDGRVASISPRFLYVQEWQNLTALLAWVKQSFLSLAIIPVSSLRVIDPRNTYLSGADITVIREIYRRHDWPSRDFDKEECLEEVGRAYNAFWERHYGGGASSTRKRYSPSTTKTIASSSKGSGRKSK